MNHIIYFLSAIPIYISIVYAFFHVITKHERKYHIGHILIIVGSSILAWIFTLLLKDIIAHPRPDLTKALFIPSDPSSFPSGHTTFMFALAFAMHRFDKSAGVILFVLALITGMARVLAGVHFWYDIIGGIVFAYIVSFMILKIVKYFYSYLFKNFRINR